MAKASTTIDISALKVAGETNKYITMIDGSGIRVHEAGSVNTNFAQINSNGLQIYNGGINTTNIIASFGTDSNGALAIIGRPYVSGATNNESHIKIDYHSLQMIDKEGDEFFHISDLRDTSGEATLTDTWIGDGETRGFDLGVPAKSVDYTITVLDTNETDVTSNYTTSVKFASFFKFTLAPSSGYTIQATYITDSHIAKAYTFGMRNKTRIGSLSVAEGYDTTAGGPYSHAEGRHTTASGLTSHAEGSDTTAGGSYSHAEGLYTKSSGSCSHAEGYHTEASGYCAHAEGVGSVATANGTHAEGAYTTASAPYAHAGGYSSIASAEGASATGLKTRATYAGQTVIGKANDEGDYAFIIGNGNAEQSLPTRSNAFMVDWDGYIYPQATKMTDFVVEQGTDGIWTYRKWNSGVAECWGRYSVTLTKYTTVGSFAGYYTTVSFPTGLFVADSIPTHTYTATVGTGFAMPASGMNASNTSMYVYTLATASANNQSCVFDIIAKGRWK